MADLVDATVGGASANSYVTIAGATALLYTRLATEPWRDATDTADRAAALIWATRLLEEQVVWKGVPATVTQALAWPQAGQVDPAGRAIPSTIIPEVIQRATAEYALALLRETRDTVSSASLAGIKSRKLGDTTIVYQDAPAVPRASAVRRLPFDIQQMVRWYGVTTGGITVPLLRG